MKWIRFALAAMVVTLAFTAASAQSGGLTVKVSDVVGPLPGAIVTISHETGFVKTTAMQTDARGEAVFPVLRPGRGYIIEVSMPNFGTKSSSSPMRQFGQVTVKTWERLKLLSLRECLLSRPNFTMRSLDETMCI